MSRKLPTMDTCQASARVNYGKYGIYNQNQEYWFGDDEGPLRYNSFNEAAFAASVICERMGMLRPAVKAKHYDGTGRYEGASVTTVLSTKQAIKNLHQRALA